MDHWILFLETSQTTFSEPHRWWPLDGRHFFGHFKNALNLADLGYVTIEGAVDVVDDQVVKDTAIGAVRQHVLDVGQIPSTAYVIDGPSAHRLSVFPHFHLFLGHPILRQHIGLLPCQTDAVCRLNPLSLRERHRVNTNKGVFHPSELI